MKGRYGYPTRSLEDLCEINIGKTPSRSNAKYWGGNHPWLSIADMNQGRSISKTKEQITDEGVRASGIKIVPGKTILLSYKLSIGKVGITERPLFTNEAIAALPVLEPKNLHLNFLYWTLRTIDLLEDSDNAAMGKTLNKAKLKQLQIPLPPLAEQKRIAAILDAADALRAKRQQTLAHLDELLQSTFLTLFGDPVTNPMGWKTSSVGSHVKVLGGYAFKSANFSNEGIPVIRISNLDGDSIDLKKCARIPKSLVGKGARFAIQPGDILIAMSGATTGKLGLVPENLNEEWLLNQRVGAYRVPANSKIHKEYLHALLRSSFYQDHVWNLAAGAAQPNISGKQLESAQIPLPPLPLQQRFAAIVGKIEAQKARHRAHLAELDTLFASLQSRAFSGEL